MYILNVGSIKCVCANGSLSDKFVKAVSSFITLQLSSVILLLGIGFDVFDLLASGCSVNVEAGLQRGRDDSVLCSGFGCQSPQQNNGCQQTLSRER